MSYTESYHERLKVYYSGTVNYPPSQNGGSIPYSGHVYEDIYVDIDVDTDPLDYSVSVCNNDVTGLTSSVGAMNAAQCETIIKNSKELSSTIVKGFFSTVRSDLSSQKAELEQKVDSRLVLLQKQAEMLRKKRDKMNEDYARTSSRYQKIFEDLNNELELRIHRVDQPVFDVVTSVDQLNNRVAYSDSIPTVSTANRETSMLQAQLNVASIRNNATKALGHIQEFLSNHAVSDHNLNQSSIQGKGDDPYLLPVCFVETIEDENMMPSANVFFDDNKGCSPIIKKAVSEFYVKRNNKQDTMAAQRENISPFFQNEIANNIVGIDQHSVRVRDLINKLFIENT